jgi:hypothetical protein
MDGKKQKNQSLVRVIREIRGQDLYPLFFVLFAPSCFNPIGNRRFACRGIDLVDRARDLR